MTAACPVELHALRVATPRLELRLGSRDELFELAALAVAGVHLPDEMPFAIAWTDGSNEPGFVERFVEYHEAALHAFGPDDWALNLLVWNAGRLVGTQGLARGERYLATRVREARVRGRRRGGPGAAPRPAGPGLGGIGAAGAPALSVPVRIEGLAPCRHLFGVPGA